MNYDEVVNYLVNKKSFHLPDYLRRVFELFDFEIDPSKVIIIAGTNGKGTTCAVLQTLLHEAGKNVGFFSSPHLEKINERIKYNCVDVSDEEFCDLFFKVHEKVHKKAHEVVQDYDLSFFEYLTFMAVYHFFVSHKNDVDFAVFEVGLGGTFDSTNIIPHNTSVITALGLDHTRILGNSLLDIATNKFGIISENNTVFHLKFPMVQAESNSTSQLPSATDTTGIEGLVNTYIKEKSARFIEAYDCSMRVSGKDPLFFISTPFGEFKLPLPGRRAMENTALAITVFQHLVENAERYMNAVEKTYWPGRMEKVCAARASMASPPVDGDAKCSCHVETISAIGNACAACTVQQVSNSSASSTRTIYLSGDHNVQGIDSLLALLPYYTSVALDQFSLAESALASQIHLAYHTTDSEAVNARLARTTIRLVVGICKGKDHDLMLSKLMDFPGAKLYLTETPVKTLKIHEYSRRFLDAADYANADPKKTLETAIADAAEDDLIVVTGSLYLVGLIRSLCCYR
ncbi:bifunctional folylpolyglutamate synthase/dihydrofolate synthase [Alphaproteobacteria bacterium]|nr:bifunctional folylpolyglutamate synthase/dihydrofolate synthase [Alphaproteobacteria bacterium]